MASRKLAVAAVALLLLCGALAPAALAASTPPPFPCGGVVREMHILAVGEANGRYFGVPTLLRVVVTPGTGEVYLSTEPLTQIDMQASARLAALVAAYVAGKNYFDYDYFISIISNSTIVGGPSAGAAITVAITAALLNKQINESVVETGMIMPDGTIGPVGGIPEKLHAAAEVHAKVMLIPAGQSIAYSLAEKRYVDVVRLGQELGVKVVEVSTIYDALHWFGINIPRPPKAQVKLPPEAVSVIRYWINESKASYLKIRPEAERELLKVPQAADIVKQYLEKARSYYISGLKDLKLHQYYSAASDFFASDIYVDTAYWIAAIASGDKSYSDLLNAVKAKLEEALNTYAKVRDEILSSNRVDIARLSIAVEIASRAIDANQTYSSLPKTAVSYSSIYNAVYAYWRSRTVMDWTRMLKAVPPTGIEVSTSSLKRHAALLTYFATTSASYIESLVGQRPFVSNILNMAEEAREYLDVDCLAALAEAMRASAYASAMLNTVFTTNLGGTADRLRNAALEAAGEAIASGFDPIVALSYIERGDTLRGVDDASAIYFYDLALVNTMWYLIIGGGTHQHAARTATQAGAGGAAKTVPTPSSTPVTRSRTSSTAATSTSTTPSTGAKTSVTARQTVTTVTLKTNTTSVTSAGAPNLPPSGTHVLGSTAVLAVAVGVGAVLGAVLGALLSRRPR